MELLGKNVFIRSVTNYYTGHIKEETKKYFVLTTAAWIPDTGRFSDALNKSVFSEVEPYPRPVLVYKSAIVDITEIGELPTKQV